MGKTYIDTSEYYIKAKECPKGFCFGDGFGSWGCDIPQKCNDKVKAACKAEWEEIEEDF